MAGHTRGIDDPGVVGISALRGGGVLPPKRITMASRTLDPVGFVVWRINNRCLGNTRYAQHHEATE